MLLRFRRAPQLQLFGRLFLRICLMASSARFRAVLQGSARQVKQSKAKQRKAMQSEVNANPLIGVAPASS